LWQDAATKVDPLGNGMERWVTCARWLAHAKRRSRRRRRKEHASSPSMHTHIHRSSFHGVAAGGAAPLSFWLDPGPEHWPGECVSV